jgi:hypothetical protein
MNKNEQPKRQIKTKERVEEHGEVFTNSREVNSMLDLVKGETERIDSRFLEPACGDGNFLAEVLRRKLNAVSKKCSSSQSSWELGGAIAVSSIYGVEILSDNAAECRERLLGIFLDEYYKKQYPSSVNEKYIGVIRFLFSANIICGDALKLLDSEGRPLIFAEWGFIGDKVQRRDFALSGLLSESKAALTTAISQEERENGAMSLFDDAPDEDYENAGLIKDRIYPLISFMELGGK